MTTKTRLPDDRAEVSLFTEGRAGRITLTRPSVMNALTHGMCLAIDAALVAWRQDPAIDVIIIDAVGEKAFCAGGDIQALYDAGLQGDHGSAQTFWRDEYRMNARLARYPKPIVCFMQGITMGGGVGLGCHASRRIVGSTSRIALPECSIGLVPDVGSSYLLSRSPGHFGEYLGLTGHRMTAAEAIYAGFADSYVTEEHWDALKAEIAATGRTAPIAVFADTSPPGELIRHQSEIDRHFALDDFSAICLSLSGSSTEFARSTLTKVMRASPLSANCTLRIIRSLRPSGSVLDALDLEYRFTYRSLAASDFMEGIRAAVIDKDRTPRWKEWPVGSADRLLAPLGTEKLDFLNR